MSSLTSLESQMYIRYSLYGQICRKWKSHLGPCLPQGDETKIGLYNISESELKTASGRDADGWTDSHEDWYIDVDY